MRLRAVVASGASLVVALTPWAAHAEADVIVRGFGTAALGVTDNAGLQVGAGARTVAAFAEVRPGVAAFIETKRTTHLVGYAFRLNWVFSSAGTQTYANQVIYRVSHDVTPRDRVVGEISATQGRTSPFYYLSSSPGVAFAAAQPTVTHFLSLGAREAWTRALGPSTTGLQQLQLGTYVPTDAGSLQSKTYTASHLLGLERRWKVDTLRGEWLTDYVVYGAVHEGGTDVPLQRQTHVALRGRWLRQLSPMWFSELGLGTTVVANVDDLGHPVVVPTAIASIRRQLEDGLLAASVSHSVASNIFLGQTLVTDEASLNAVVPVDRRRRFRALLSTGYGRGHQTGGPSTAVRFDFYRADAGMLFVVSKGVRTSARVQRFSQIGTDTGTSSFTLTTALIDVTVVLPEPPTALGAPF